MNFYNYFKDKRVLLITLLVLPWLILVVVLGVFLINNNNSNLSSTAWRGGQNNSESMEHLDVEIPAQEVLDSTSTQLSNNLLYLIEEEKLAHDVYIYFYNKYGTRIFSNISNSESTHQNRVLDLLEARNIQDPRTAEAGKFSNPDLQKLYDDLIAKGNVSQQAAIQVGIDIEELDIKDIESFLGNLEPAQTDVKSALEALLNGSNNHLRAFNRQLS